MNYHQAIQRSNTYDEMIENARNLTSVIAQTNNMIIMYDMPIGLDMFGFVGVYSRLRHHDYSKPFQSLKIGYFCQKEEDKIFWDINDPIIKYHK